MPGSSSSSSLSSSSSSCAPSFGASSATCVATGGRATGACGLRTRGLAAWRPPPAPRPATNRRGAEAFAAEGSGGAAKTVAAAAAGGGAAEARPSSACACWMTSPSKLSKPCLFNRLRGGAPGGGGTRARIGGASACCDGGGCRLSAAAASSAPAPAPAPSPMRLARWLPAALPRSAAKTNGPAQVAGGRAVLRPRPASATAASMQQQQQQQQARPALDRCGLLPHRGTAPPTARCTGKARRQSRRGSRCRPPNTSGGRLRAAQTRPWQPPRQCPALQLKPSVGVSLPQPTRMQGSWLPLSHLLRLRRRVGAPPQAAAVAPGLPTRRRRTWPARQAPVTMTTLSPTTC
mmetsp:Transcript_91482/g.296041  ORF Transcript_91482/g.296041 Transcript_91482/m.296041 type:complete len:348 (-) Transcript_91482:687-1730(-)